MLIYFFCLFEIFPYSSLDRWDLLLAESDPGSQRHNQIFQQIGIGIFWNSNFVLCDMFFASALVMKVHGKNGSQRETLDILSW